MAVGAGAGSGAAVVLGAGATVGAASARKIGLEMVVKERSSNVCTPQNVPSGPSSSVRSAVNEWTKGEEVTSTTAASTP